jgi:hypothetical protein
MRSDLYIRQIMAISDQIHIVHTRIMDSITT